MFAASVAFAYAAWEAYIEDVAIEVTEFMADDIDAEHVPATAQKAIDDPKTKPSAWELLVHPGWRRLWVKRVRLAAKGDETQNLYGLNTARESQVRGLFELVGLDPFRATQKDELAALDLLVTERGTVVHTATTPDDFKKGNAKKHRDLVLALADAVDETLRTQAHALTGKYPWT